MPSLQIAFGLAFLQALSATAVSRDSSQVRAGVRTVETLVASRKLLLRGPADRIEFAVPVPRSARGRRASFDAFLTFSANAVPEANVQFFANGIRRSMLTVSDVAAGVPTVAHVDFSAEDTKREFLSIAIEARLPMPRDRCPRDTRTSAWVRIDGSSRIAFSLDPSVEGERQVAVDALPERVVFSLADRSLSASSMDSVLRASERLARTGHSIGYVRRTGQSLTAVAMHDVQPSDILRMVDVERILPAMHPTLPELGLQQPARTFARSAEWRIPLDMRALPPGRIPERIVLNIVVSPDEQGDRLGMRVRLNDVILRDVVVLGNGTKRTVRVLLPSDEMGVYSELRLNLERKRDSVAGCMREESGYPSQIQDDSYLVTTSAPANPSGFGVFIAALPSSFDLFLPEAAFASAENTLPLLLSGARSLWGAQRRGRIQAYATTRPPAPTRTSIVVESPAGKETVVHLGRLNSHPVMFIRPALRGAALPVIPDTYGTADSVVFDSTGALRAARVPSRLQSASVDAVRFALEYRLWVVLLALAALSGAFAGYARTRRRPVPVR